MSQASFWGESAYRKKLGTRLRTARERKGITQEQLARGICTGAFLSMVEQGHNWPSMSSFVQFARRLKIDPAKLLQ